MTLQGIRTSRPGAVSLLLLPEHAILLRAHDADVPRSPFGADPAAVTIGKKLFEATCPTGVGDIDVSTRREPWRYALTRLSGSAGVLGARGGVRFAGSAEGNLLVLNRQDGKLQWHFKTGGPISAAPISHALDGPPCRRQCPPRFEWVQKRAH